MIKDIPVVLLCGGIGTRLREETQFMPKPMVIIGNKPILWHIMKIFEHHGFRRFIFCLGYKGEMIREYFIHYPGWPLQNVPPVAGSKCPTPL